MKELKVKISWWPYRLESWFTSAWLKVLRAKWYYCDKISDSWIGMKKVDTYIVTDKQFYVCEIKVIDKDIFHISRLRSNQYASLRLADTLSPGSAIVCVYSKTQNKYKIIPFDVILKVERDESIRLTFN